MSKHTPGPWTTYDGYIIESEKCQVGEVYFYSYEEGERIDIPYRANARLMAAAPELLEALKELYNASLVMEQPRFYKALSEAKKLIAKIESDE